MLGTTHPLLAYAAQRGFVYTTEPGPGAARGGGDEEPRAGRHYVAT
jgi:hypothetical protein